MTQLQTAVPQLTPRQIECLSLVRQHMTSKKIGQLLGISPHTVDERIGSALQVLGCRSRYQAAQVIAADCSRTAMFQWQSTRVEPYVEFELRPKGTYPTSVLPLPFATAAQPQNEMGVLHLLLWILGIGCGSAFSMGLYLAGLESLARLIQGT